MNVRHKLLKALIYSFEIKKYIDLIKLLYLKYFQNFFNLLYFNIK